jgi:signal peptidase II
MNNRLRTVLIILAVAALDWITKIYIRTHVSLYDIVAVIPRVFNIVHAENPGAAFSMLADAPPMLRSVFLIGVSVVVMVIVGFMLWRAPGKGEGVWMRIALALVFGGALGNFIDRAFRGTVTDFIQVFIGSYEFPSFNVADSAINVGAWLLVWELWRGRKAPAK